MARPGEMQPVGLPRPGKALRAVLLTLLGIWVAFAIGLNWGGASEELFLFFCGNTEAVLQGQFWRLFTAPIMHVPTGSQGVWHILAALLGLYFLAPALEREWGRGRFLRFLLFVGLFAYGSQMLIGMVLPASVSGKLVPEYWFGATPVVEGIAIAWALSFRGTVMLMFVLPVSSRGLIFFVVGATVLYTFAAAMPTSGLIAPFGGMIAGWLLGGGSPSPLRRFWLKMRLAQLDAEARRESKAQKRRAARSGFKVIEGGRGRDSDPDGGEDSSPGGRGKDGRWLN